MNKTPQFVLLAFCPVFLYSTNGVSGPLPSPGADDVRRGASQAAEFRDELQGLQKKHGIPGMSVAVVQHGRVVFAEGFGFADLENGVRATENTPYNIASCTKPLAAVLLMKLVEEGKLDLDAPMADILKEKLFPFRYQGGEIRGYAAFGKGVKEIMQNGPPALRSDFVNSYQDYRWDRERITVRHHLTHTAEGVPGTRYRYSGDLYSWLSLVAEEASGRPFDELLVDTIVRPLRMNRTIPSPSAEIRCQILADRTKYYRPIGNGDFAPVEVERPIKWPEAFRQAGLDIDLAFLINAGGDVVSTVLDLARFDVALDQDRLIAARTRATMFTPSRSNTGQTLPYALGWLVQDWKGRKLAWHFGDGGYYSSLILKVPAEELTFILLANSRGASARFNLGGGDDPENVLKSPFAAAFLGRFARSNPYPAWERAKTPEARGWSSAKLAVAKDYSEGIGSAAVMVVDDGLVVDSWGDVARKYHCHSMRKSLLSALYGIYVAEGRIRLNQTLEALGVDDDIPLTNSEKQATVGDLLTARSGIYIPAVGESAFMKADRPVRGSHAPGTFWYYNNWDFNALGTIFDQESGEQCIYSAFARRIAEPIGLQDFAPEDHHYYHAPGTRHPYYGFRMSTRDLARFGLLFLRQGRWQEKKILPAEWVRESTTSHSTIGPDSGYGYMWWTGSRAGLLPNVNVAGHSYCAAGGNGHWVIVLPYRSLVVVHRADSDTPGPEVYDFQMGTLLWLILDAAGETNIGESPRIEAARGERLKDESLDKTFVGRALSTVIAGRKIRLVHSEDRQLALAVGNRVISAKWWVEGDSYCNDLPSGLGGRFQILRDADTVKLYDANGFLFLRLALG